MGFKIKIRHKDLFGFSLYHSYEGFFGKIWIVISLAALVGCVVTFGTVTTEYSIALLFVGLLFTVINPAMLYYKTGKRMKKNHALFELPYQYTCQKDGILLVQGEETAKYTWDLIFQFVNTKKTIYMMMDPIHACIIPKDQLGEKSQELINYIKNTVPVQVRKKGFH